MECLGDIQSYGRRRRSVGNETSEEYSERDGYFKVEVNTTTTTLKPETTSEEHTENAIGIIFLILYLSRIRTLRNILLSFR